MCVVLGITSRVLHILGKSSATVTLSAQSVIILLRKKSSDINAHTQKLDILEWDRVPQEWASSRWYSAVSSESNWAAFVHRVVCAFSSPFTQSFL